MTCECVYHDGLRYRRITEITAYRTIGGGLRIDAVDETGIPLRDTHAREFTVRPR